MSDAVRLAVPVTVGGTICVVAWFAAGDRVRLGDQTGWVSLGVVGLALAVVGESGWIRRGRRAVFHRASLALGEVSSLAPALAPPASEEGDPVAADGMKHFHRPGCPIALGRGWPSMPGLAHERAGRAACGICTPMVGQ